MGNESGLPYHVAQTLTLRNLVRTRRKDLGWTQADVAGKAQVSRSFVSRMERGDLSTRFSGVCRVVAALGVRIEILPGELFGPTGKRPATVIRETL